VNTNAFGDHTFGNYVFPAETRIVANRRTLETLRATTAAEIERRMAPTVGNDLSVFDGVQLRLPDETFDDQWSVDLGGRRVEARFFGAGMSPSDTIVYVPGARVAWTGNLIFGDGTIPWAQSGGIATYRATLERVSQALDVGTIVPGHGALTTGDADRGLQAHDDCRPRSRGPCAIERRRRAYAAAKPENSHRGAAHPVDDRIPPLEPAARLSGGGRKPQ
jgi:cyclase